MPTYICPKCKKPVVVLKLGKEEEIEVTCGRCKTKFTVRGK